ncbi:hypothetical protein QR680_008191 [Steinernema hermaphroditum]|uniref:Uncharacterized protein n=1 Tax=Steinernema hermaphroditum TaxID=289476 RepID=A0AA39M7M6_9BILA|nr:hypothetical protein QR680_008191 [Steinernema hermaphroditum]
MTGFSLRSPLFALCLAAYVLYVAVAGGQKKDADVVTEISINEHFVFKWGMRYLCNNSYYNVTSKTLVETKPCPTLEKDTLNHHHRHRFDMRLVRVKNLKNRMALEIEHISPTFEYIRHKHRFPGPLCNIDYEFINDKPFCDEVPREKSVCANANLLLFEFKKGWQARFHYDSLVIYTPMVAENPIKFSIDDDQCKCRNFVSHSCSSTDTHIANKNVILAYDPRGRLGHVHGVGSMAELVNGNVIHVKEMCPESGMCATPVNVTTENFTTENPAMEKPVTMKPQNLTIPNLTNPNLTMPNLTNPNLTMPNLTNPNSTQTP